MNIQIRKINFLLICLMLTQSAFALNILKTPALPRQAAWAIPVAPQANLFQVDKQLYRSEQLKFEDIGIVKQQGINTIINLRFFDRDEDQERLSQAGFKIINRPLKTWAVKPKQLAEILHQIQLEQAQGKKVLVHCYHGADRTGITIAMYRIIRQGWSIEQAKTEMMHGGFGYHSIWRNLEKLLTPQQVDIVRAELNKLESNSATSTSYKQ